MVDYGGKFSHSHLPFTEIPIPMTTLAMEVDEKNWKAFYSGEVLGVVGVIQGVFLWVEPPKTKGQTGSMSISS